MRFALLSVLLLAACSIHAPATLAPTHAARPRATAKQGAARRPAWRSEGVARRVEMSTDGATVLMDDGRAWAWADDHGERPSYRAPPGWVPGAVDLVDVCGSYGVHADGTMGQTMSSGGYRRGEPAERGVRSCAFDLLPRQFCVLGQEGDVRCRFGVGNRGSPAPVSTRRDFDRVVVGDHAGCALTRDAALYCWSDEAPRAEPALDRARDVAISDGGICVARLDGTLWCRPRETRRPFRPDPAAGEPGFRQMPLADVAHVALYQDAGVAITTDGRALAWGRHNGFWLHDDGPAEVGWLRGARSVVLRR